MDSFSLRSCLYGLRYDTITAPICSLRTTLSNSCVMLTFLETCTVTDRACRLTWEQVFCTEANRWLEWQSSKCPILWLLLYFPLTSSVQHKPYQYRYHFRRSEGNLQIYEYWRKKRKSCRIFVAVPCCMLFQSLIYCSNSCTSLHFKILKSHTKTLKICPCMFRSPLKPSSGGPWPYFAKLLNWNVDLHLL
jgi:hypothetical protein